MSEVLT